MGPPDSEICARDLLTLKFVCEELGVPLAAEKQEGPSTNLTFLGITIDTVHQMLSLPHDKLARLLKALDQWAERKTCKRRELESLIGVLQHACTVIQPGRTFLHNAIPLLSMAKQPRHHIRLTKEFHSDIYWWKTFASCWNGKALIIHPQCPETAVTSDASGSWGCEAWHKQNWFQFPWDELSMKLHIAVKELLPILIASAIWGTYWKGHRVQAFCDNTAAVAAINNRTSKDRHMMHMLRCLFFIEAYHQFQLTACHISGTSNKLADNLSRNQMESFHNKFRTANANPSLIPNSLLQWLLDPVGDWTSPSWIQLFSSSVQKG